MEETNATTCLALTIGGTWAARLREVVLGGAWELPLSNKQPAVVLTQTIGYHPGRTCEEWAHELKELRG